DLLTSRRDIPPALDRLITRCVEKAPSGRFQSARDLVFALENLLDASAPAAHVAPASSGGQRRGWAVAACLMGLVAVGAGWWAIGQRARTVSKPAVSAPRVLAVLPFGPITRDGKPGYC